MSKIIKCPTCKGTGVQTLHGAAYTADDIEEAGGSEFIQDMLAGHYDHDCDMCGGAGQIDKEEYEDRMEQLWEQRMGY